MTSQINGSAPSTISITRQFQRSSSQPENGADAARDNGRAVESQALARARSVRGNQCERRINVAGYIPPSATPRRNRITHSCCHVCTKPHPKAQAPQTTSEQLTNHFVLQ